MSRTAVATPKRNSSQTRQRILDAAIREFSAKGFAGARMDAIAERARINKRLIYVYWGNKEELFRQILTRKVLAMKEIFATATGLPPDRLVRYFEGSFRDPDLVRLIQWEALRQGRRLIAEDERRAALRDNVASVVRDQERGSITKAVEAEYLWLVFMALTAFPIAFPQNVRLVTGLQWNDPRFQEKWTESLRTIGGLLVTQPGETRGEDRTGVQRASLGRLSGRSNQRSKASAQHDQHG
jgi:AcrR family transcriptional regulator